MLEAPSTAVRVWYESPSKNDISIRFCKPFRTFSLAARVGIHQQDRPSPERAEARLDGLHVVRMLLHAVLRPMQQTTLSLNGWMRVNPFKVCSLYSVPVQCRVHQSTLTGCAHSHLT